LTIFCQEKDNSNFGTPESLATTGIQSISVCSDCSKQVIFGLIALVGHLCLVVLKGCAALALSFETIRSHSEQLQDAATAQRIETIVHILPMFTLYEQVNSSTRSRIN